MALAVVSISPVASAQTQIKGRVLVMVDTSGSMTWHFGDCGSTGGDGGSPAVFCDNNIGTSFACNKNQLCTQANGGLNLFPTTLSNPSRMYAAKSALNDVILSAAGSLDFGLERYALSGNGEIVPGFDLCNDAKNCCQTQVDGSTRGRCVPMATNDYPDVLGDVNCDGNLFTKYNHCNLTWLSGCGTSLGCKSNCSTTEGGEMLVQPASGSSTQVQPWIDFTEDFCSSTGSPGGAPRNPELRGAGFTPLAGAVRTAKNQWYTPIYQASNGGSCNPQTNPLCDPQINCRPYVNVVMTDGGEDCEDSSNLFTDPQKAVAELTAVNSTNPVKTYVIAMSFAQNEPCNNNGADLTGASCPKTGPNNGCTSAGYCSCNVNADCGVTCDGFSYTCGTDHICHHPALASLNAMANAGSTGTARFANNQTDIEAAFADIVNSSVLYETCNGKDDNCNGLVDEGLGVYEECTQGSQCATGSCSGGRCTCGKNADCATGYLCSAGLCAPACTVGVGACLKSGVSKCTTSGSATCCANDGKTACSALVAGTPSKEICNGIDDDCNGLTDDLNGVPGAVCTSCSPIAETCNGKDDDCDGIVDDHLIDTNQPCGLNLGACTPGVTECVPQAGKAFPDSTDHLVCIGGVMPATETCNGIDDDCNGVVDGLTRACYDGPAGTENVGVCRGGAQTCPACPDGQTCAGEGQWTSCVGEVVPSVEVCNGKDDDCNGKVDDVQGAGGTCCPSGKCGTGVCKAGTLECSGGSLQCIGAVGPSEEICDGIDNDCNGKIDDVPGVGAPCTQQGLCNATLQCNTSTHQLVCMGGKSMPEVCNGVDDDCDGIVDNPDKVAMNDPRVGKSCPMNYNPQWKPPCMPGTTVCKSGQVVCQGEVGPSTEICNGKDDNCDGQIDNGAVCPPGFDCYEGGCYQHCMTVGEFQDQCPGGYNCDVNKYCVPDACVSCTATQKCKNNTCVEKCSDVTCPTGYVCNAMTGGCDDATCVTKGCPSGQYCDTDNRTCVPDPCFGITCPSGQYCDATGRCESPCMCQPGQRCAGGACVTDPCAGKQCNEGSVCNPSTGLCVTDPCAGVECVPGQTCVDGMCVQSPCSRIQCPAGTVCTVDEFGGAAYCASPPGTHNPKDLVVGAGGGGFLCDVGAGVARRGGPSPVAPALVGLLVLAALQYRRRRLRALRVEVRR